MSKVQELQAQIDVTKELLRNCYDEVAKIEYMNKIRKLSNELTLAKKQEENKPKVEQPKPQPVVQKEEKKEEPKKDHSDMNRGIVVEPCSSIPDNHKNDEKKEEKKEDKNNKKN